MRKQLSEAKEMCAEQNEEKMSNEKAAQKRKDLELEAFKRELADVRAKQLFAVNEVKVLMAKLAAKKGGRNSSGGSADGIELDGAKSMEAQQIDFIDENLKNLKKRKGRKGNRRRR